MPNTKTKTEQSELLNIQSGTDTKDKENYPLIIRTQIKGTPFYIVGNDEIGYNITWGKYKFNDQPIPHKLETETWVEDHQWQIILHMIAIGIAADKDINKSE